MRRLVAVTALGTVLFITATSATALGLGRVRTSSFLGDPLDLSIAVSAEASDALSPECIKAEVYSGDARIPDEMVRLRIERSGSGIPNNLRVVTGSRIDEPLARLDLTLSCGTSLTRRYVVFVDPPVLDLAATAPPAVALAPMIAARGDEPAPVVRPRRTRAAEREARQSARGAQARSQSTVVAAARSDPPRRTRRAAQASVAPRREPGPRLQLESAPDTAAASPVRRPRTSDVGTAAGTAGTVATAALAAAGPAASGAEIDSGAASAAVGGLLDQLAAKADAGAAERVRALEAELARLRGSNQSLQKSVADLEQQLQQARSGGSAGPMAYAVVGVLLLLLLALAVLAWRRRRQRNDSDWLAGAAAADAGFDGDEPRLIAQDAPSEVNEDASSHALVAAVPMDTESVAPAASGSKPAGVGVPVTPHEITAVHDPRREVSVEELIDLEQQADFFVVLGQDDAAVDLLLGHVQGTGGASPLPYLKLLEIHRRRGEREAYDRIRDRFNRRFGALAPDWESHSGHGRALEEYPSVVAQLQAAWPDPASAMQALSALLFKRDEDGLTFDLPAYAELLFLYSMARDLAEHQQPEGGVDLLLPLDEDIAAVAAHTAPGPVTSPGDGFTSPADIGLPELRLDSLRGSLDEPVPLPSPLRNDASNGTPPRPTSPVTASPPDSGWSFDLQLDDEFKAPAPAPAPTTHRPPDKR